MTPTTDQPIASDVNQANPNQKTVTRTVFDLATFDKLELEKVITLPDKPDSIEAALSALGNDKDRLLDIIYEGLCSDAEKVARENIEGFTVVDDEDDTKHEPYTGKFADESASKKINGAVLAIAKMQGFDKSLPKEKKRELKESARTFIRSNPALLASIQ